MNKPQKFVEPSNPYDAKAWHQFYADHPGYRRSVGAAGVNEGEGESSSADNPGESSEQPGAQPAPKPSDDSSGANGDQNKGSVTDKEAELLRDLMKHKEARKAAEAAAKEIQDRFKDIDPEEYRKFKQSQKEAEEKRLLERGEFDRLKEQMAQQHQSELEQIKTSLTEKDLLNQQLMAQIAELTVGSGFTGSKFITENTVLTPSKARKLYGDHFEIENGRVVGYDKPRGSADRTPIVDSRGETVSFEEAIKRIIESDPEKDQILRSSMKPGAASSPAREANTPPFEKKPMSSLDKIGAGVSSLVSQIGTNPTGPKLG